MPVPRILFCGLDDETASRLTHAASSAYDIRLSAGRSILETWPEVERFRPHLLCVPANPEFYGPLRSELQARGCQAPFVVVSQSPAAAEWKMALMEGAADYFGPPFETGQVGWIFASAAKSAPMGSFLRFAKAN
jgi:hypothetical protein